MNSCDALIDAVTGMHMDVRKGAWMTSKKYVQENRGVCARNEMQTENGACGISYLRGMRFLLASLLTAFVMLFGFGITARAEGIGYVSPTGWSIAQQPDQDNNCQFIVNLNYGVAANGSYHQGVKVYLVRVDSDTVEAVYYLSQYVTINDGNPIGYAGIPGWTVNTYFSKPKYEGNYRVDLYYMKSPWEQELMAKSDNFHVEGGDHKHNYDWRITAIGSSLVDQKEEYVCTGCGEKTGNVRITPSSDIFFTETVRRIDDTPQGGLVVIHHGSINSYPRALMDKIASRRDLTFIFYYSYNGAYFKTTIPARSPVNVSYDYYGPAMLCALYPYEIVAYNPSIVENNDVDMITKIAPGSVLVLSGIDTYTRGDMVMIANRRDVSVILKVRYLGVNYSVTIPAGAYVDTSADYYGPMKLTSLYPYTVE